MRESQRSQLWLSPATVARRKSNPVYKDLERMSQVIDQCPDMTQIYQRVQRDLVGERREDCGATGLSAEQALRTAIIKEKMSLSYRDLEFHLSDSATMQEFVKLEPGKSISKSTLNRDIRLISEDTWNEFNACLKRFAEKQGIEDGACVRSDTTATQSNIHHPTDASLLVDSVRVLTRLITKLKKNTAT